MKIALVCPKYGTHGGVERFASNLIAYLLDQGHEVHLLTSKIEGSLDQRVIAHKVPRIRLSRSIRVLSFLYFSERILNKYEFDIVQGLGRTLQQDVFRAGGGCHREFRRRVLQKIKNPILRYFKLYQPYQWLLLFLEKRQFSRSHYKKIVAVSHQVKEEIVRNYGVPEADIAVIHNGVDTELFHPQNREKYFEEIRNRFHIKSEEQVILFLGTGFERKGVKTLIEAFSHIQENHPRSKLLIVGKDDRKQKQTRLVRKLNLDGRVIFAGPQSNVKKFYAAADLFVFPTLYDPFANVCLEAMASGLPVITSQINGASEVMGGMESLLLDDPTDSKTLADKMAFLLDNQDQRQVMARAARAIAEKHSFAQAGQQWVQLYESLRAQKSEGRIVKDNRFRTVLHVGNLYVKKFKQVRLGDHLKRALFGTKAKKEFEILARARQLGIPVPEPVEYLEGRDDSTLFTREIPGAHEAKWVLQEILKNKLDLEDFLKGLASFINTLIQKGFFHRDLHLGNIMYAQGKFYLLDVHRSEIHSRLSRRQKIITYAQVLHSLHKMLHQNDLKSFLNHCGLTPSECADVWRSMRRQRKIHIQSRSKRCLVNSTDFAVLKQKKLKTYHRRSHAELVARHSELLKSAKALKKDPDRETLHCGSEWSIKRFRYSLIDKISNLFKGSPGFRSWRHAHALKVRGINVPRAHLLMETTSESILIQEWIEGKPLYDFVRHHHPSWSDEQKDNFVLSLAEFVSTLHREGVYHHDLKGNNILARFSDQKFLYTLIDLDRVSYYRTVSHRLRIKNLAQLNASIGTPISVEDRLNFLKYYSAVGSQLPDFETFRRQVMRLTIARKHVWPSPR